MSHVLAQLWDRVRRKVTELLPVLIGALVVTGLLALIVYFLMPFLPEEYRPLFEAVQAGDWEEGQETLAQLFESWGPAQPYIFLLIQVLQVVFAPIPGQLIGLLGGFIFGFWRGLFLTMVGLAIGSMIAFLIGRFLGETVVRKVVPKSILQRFDYLITQGGYWNFFMLFLLPALPDDAICFIAGLTRLSLWRLLLVCLAGRLPGMAVLLFVGASVGSSMLVAQVLLGIALTAAVILWLYSDEAEMYFHRLSKGEAVYPKKK